MPVLPAPQRLRLRIICRRPPPPQQHGAVFGLQDKSTATQWMIHAGEALPSGDIRFSCECRVRFHPATGEPDFSGPFIHGPPGMRFLYLSWRPQNWHPGHPEPLFPSWLRRMKVTLSPVTRGQVEEALRTDRVLEAAVPGTGRDGGPSCATVPLERGGWTLVNG